MQSSSSKSLGVSYAHQWARAPWYAFLNMMVKISQLVESIPNTPTATFASFLCCCPCIAAVMTPALTVGCPIIIAPISCCGFFAGSIKDCMTQPAPAPEAQSMENSR